MTMGPERSKPLHNFTLPYGLKWGNQRHLRCAKVESNGEISSIHRRSNGSESSIGRKMETIMVDRRGSNDRFSRKLRSPGKEDAGEGIGAVREKLMFDLLTEADKMKETIFKEGMEEQPKKFPSPTPAPETATTLTGAVSDAADFSRPWNLRTRRAACKEPNGFFAGAGAVAGGNGGGSKSGLKIDTNRTNAPAAGASSVGEKRQRVKFSVPLPRSDIEEDFMAMVGHRPHRRKYISKKREDLKERGYLKESEEGFDLLTFYLKEEEYLGVKCDDKFLRDSILNLMIAGRDTTSSALTWFIWLVSTNPQVEKKIRDELNFVIPNEEVEKFRLFNVQELNKLVYLHGALCDSLRLYPPVPFQHKVPLEEDILPSGHKVHPKLKIMFSLYAMGRMESIWGKDCLEFKPERWISERGTIKHEPSYKFLTFNAGPRTCLGKEVAFTQMKAVAAAIIHNYQVELVKGHPVQPNASVILYMRHGFKVRIKRRWT